MNAAFRAMFGTLCAALSVGAVAEPATVRWQADRLSVCADKASRADLLREVARQTHTDIDGLALVTGDVTLHASAVPLDAALTMIADDGGYALVRRSSGGRARYTLYIVGRAPGAAAPPHTADIARPPGPPTSTPMPIVPKPLTRPPSQDSGVTVTDESG